MFPILPVSEIMIKTIPFILRGICGLALLMPQSVLAQSGSWTWMKGDSLPLSFGVFGQQGVASVNNTPPALYEAANWTDAAGNFWLFGGVHYTDFNMYADLWKYDIAANQWIWVKGPGVPNQPGIYGVQGVPSAINNPGARAWGAATWTDPDGNLWLFGGSGIDDDGEHGRLNDLWRYDIAQQQWTWMKGDKTINGPSVYGMLRVEDPVNQIPARDESSCTWTLNNEFWIYGGVTNSGLFNDVWRYNWFTNSWTWMNGGEQLNREPHHGVIQVADESNDPGGRFAYCSWLDCENNLLFFGGENANAYNDLWLYDRNTNLWTWMDGNSYPNSYSYYGEYCEESESFNPAARTENRARWRDRNGNLWVFGGFNTSSPASAFSDLWRYNPSARNWALIHGTPLPNLYGRYGMQQVPHPENYPRSRGGALSWQDASGNLWLFGGLAVDNQAAGYPFVTLNDLWKYEPDPDCFYGSACNLTIVPEFGISDSLLCAGQCIDFAAQPSWPGTTYHWYFQGAVPPESELLSPEGICYPDPGQFDVTLVAIRDTVADTLHLPALIHVSAYPDTPAIVLSGNTMTSSPADFYQWQLNGVNIAGANGQSYTITASGIYTVITTNTAGCWNQATLSAELLPDPVSQQDVVIYPNLAHSSFSIHVSGNGLNDHIIILLHNMLGQELYYFHQQNNPSGIFKVIDVSMLPAGVYHVTVQSGSNIYTEKVVVTR